MRARRKRAVLAWIVAAVVAASGAPAQGQAGAEKGNPRPKLVVLLVVDQMRGDYVDKFRQQWAGGLRRLLEQGAWFRQAAFPYANTFTCVGHATISTGALPVTHGIAANAWWDRAAGKAIACTDDPQARAISYGARVEGHDGPARLEAPSFADELRAQLGGQVRVVSFSLKARSAIMLAGHRATAVTWHDDRTGAWVTSSAYANEPIGFLATYIKAHPVEADFGKSWTRLLPESAYTGESATAGERPPPVWTPGFPHVLKGRGEKPDADFYRLWELSPFADSYLVGMAEAAVDALGLGRGGSTDFLGISFSTLDLVGHLYGPRSVEVQDVLARLDRSLGQLFTHLDRAVGPGNYVVALSADHGVSPVPEQLAALGFDAGRLQTRELVQRIEKAIEAFLGAGRHVVRVIDGDIYFAPGVYEKLVAEPAAMRAVEEAIQSLPGVARVFRGEELRGRPVTADPILRAASLSYVPGRSGELVVVLRPYWLFSSEGYELGTSHGTPYGYDEHVPLFLMGRGIRPVESFSPATPADIAPTLAALCGITLARSDGRALEPALAVPVPTRTAPAAPRR